MQSTYTIWVKQFSIFTFLQNQKISQGLGVLLQGCFIKDVLFIQLILSGGR